MHTKVWWENTKKRKRPLVRPSRELEDNIKTYNYYMRFDCFSLGIFLLLCLCIFIVMYVLCVNVHCAAATGCQPNCI